MGRPTEKQAAQMKRDMTRYVGQGLSLTEIARITAKSPQAVRQYCLTHGLETDGMRQHRKNLDNVNGQEDSGGVERRPQDE